MRNVIKHTDLKRLDQITYDLHYFIRKVRSIRNEKTSVEEFAKQMKFFSEEIFKSADKLEDWNIEVLGNTFSHETHREEV